VLCSEFAPWIGAQGSVTQPAMMVLRKIYGQYCRGMALTSLGHCQADMVALPRRKFWDGRDLL
jgi:hypothetical protein